MDQPWLVAAGALTALCTSFGQWSVAGAHLCLICWRHIWKTGPTKDEYWNSCHLPGAPVCPQLYSNGQAVRQLQDKATSEYKATVTGGIIHCNGREVPLPWLRGTGTFRVRYLGADVRIFENVGSSLAVQVREDLLQDNFTLARDCSSGS